MYCGVIGYKICVPSDKARDPEVLSASPDA